MRHRSEGPKAAEWQRLPAVLPQKQLEEGMFLRFFFGTYFIQYHKINHKRNRRKKWENILEQTDSEERPMRR